MMCEVAAATGSIATRADECASPLLRRRFIPMCPALRCDRFGICRPGQARLGGALLVVRDYGQLVHVLQQNAAALQVEDAVLAPGLELAIDALARCTDEDAELLLRDVHLGAEIR